jgi:hypothetical protein
MADIQTSDVTYVMKRERVSSGTPQRKENRVQVSFGDSLLTYPTNGIPLDGFKFGLPNGQVEDVNITDETGGGGLKWTYDSENNTLRAHILGITGLNFEGDEVAPTITLQDAAPGTSTPTSFQDGQLAVEGGAAGVEGVVDPITPTGTVGATAGSLTELSGAVAPTTLVVEVTGY